MSNFDEVILAYEMNGVPLPKIHGGRESSPFNFRKSRAFVLREPTLILLITALRVVVAGYIGARSTKWLTRINVLDEPSNGPVQRQ